MAVDRNIIQLLREQTGAGIVDCKKALEEAQGDVKKATELLRKKGEKIAIKKQNRAMNQGLIEAYIHTGGKVGAMVELNCETDFVAKNEEFKELSHDIAMQVAATNPLYLKPEDIPEEVLEKEKEIFSEQIESGDKPKEIIDKIIEGKLAKYFEEVCLLNQPFIKDNEISIEELLKQKIAKIGENIQIKKFIRFSL